MQIIQQKLIWFLGCGSLLLIFYRIDLAPRMISNQTLAKLKAGLILVTAGAAIGIISHLGLFGQWLLNSGLSFYLESMLGYFFGGVLIVWSIMDWSKDYSERRGEPLAKSRLRILTGKVSEVVLKEHSTYSLLENVSNYLLTAFNCQAITLHRAESDGNLNLVFQSGLTSETEEALRHPQKESIFYIAGHDKQIMSSDSSSDLYSIARLGAKNCIIESGLSLPLVSDGHILGVLTILCARQKDYKENEFDLLEIVSSALTTAMRVEKTEHDHLHESGFRTLLRLISSAFEHQTSLLSSLIDSAKSAYALMPFDELNLYVLNNGSITSHTFHTPEGGTIKLIEGHLTGIEYPYLYKDVSETGVYKISDRQAIIAPFYSGTNSRAWLEIRLESAPLYISDLMRAWSLIISRKIGQELLEKSLKQIQQRLGAIRFYQERALATDNVAGLLQEMAALVIDLGMATFCRIFLTDPQKINLKTAALAQIRPLHWPTDKDEIPTAEVEALRRVLVTRRSIEFDQGNSLRKISEREANLILPEGARHGLILPLTIGNEAVGLLMLGEFREHERSFEPDQSEIFISNLANMISMVLSWHKEKRITQEINEGKKKLTIIQREPQGMPTELTPKLRSRINGPLAGIMASCEYLRNSYPVQETDVGRYLGIIERNAARIHEITMEMNLAK